MAVSAKQPATTTSEGYGLWLLADPKTATTQNLEAARRVQRVDISADRGSENLFELGNEGIVEIKEDIPVVTLTISGNQVASDISSNDVAALHWLALVSNNDPSGVNREKIFSIGEPLEYHYTSTNGTWYLLETTEVDDFDELITSPGEEDTSIMGITTDVLIPIKRGDSLDRVFAVSQAYTTSVGWTFNVDGVATFDVTLEADNMTFYQDAARDVEIESQLITTSMAADNEITITTAAGTSNVYAVYLNGEELTGASALADMNTTGARKWFQTAEQTVQFTTGILSGGDVIRYRFDPSATYGPVWSDGANINYGLTAAAGDQGGIRKDEMDIYLLTDTTAGRIVCGFEPSVSGEELSLNPGYAQVVCNTPVSSRLDLYVNSVQTAYLTSSLGGEVEVSTYNAAFILSASDGTLVASARQTGGVPTNGVLVGTIHASANSKVESVLDARDFGRTDLALVQNAAFRADLSRNVVNQLGYTRNVEKSLNKPVPITVDVTANDADGELMTLLSGGTWADDIAAASEEIKLSELSNTLGIQVNLFSSTSKTDANHKVTIESVDADVTNISLSSGVGAIGEMSLTLNSDAMRLYEAL